MSFQLIDFQPVRDLTFIIDLRIFHSTGLNPIIWQNLLWWILSCLMVNRILKKVFPEIKINTIFIITLIFAVYPLFSQSVGWGLARKHILSFFFTTWLTDLWLKEREDFTYKEITSLSLIYFSSIFSHPINILWPLWAVAHILLIRPKLLAKSFKAFIPLAILFIIGVSFNYFYYKTSPVHLANYANALAHQLNMADQILIFGHYIFQLFFPYLLSYRYTIAHWATLVGLGLFGLFGIFIREKKIPSRWFMCWAIFAFLPFVMVYSVAQFDTYLLIPALGIWILCLSLIEKALKVYPKSFRLFGLIFLIFCLSFTFNESKSWNNELQMVKKGFERRPSCLTASDYLRISYENDHSGPIEARKYLYNYNCERFSYTGKQLIVLHTYMLFHEDDLPWETRLEKLKNLAHLGFFPQLALASIYIKNKMYHEADLEIEKIETRWVNTHFKSEYIPIVARYLRPYCIQRNKKTCIHITERFASKAVNIFYK